MQEVQCHTNPANLNTTLPSNIIDNKNRNANNKTKSQAAFYSLNVDSTQSSMSPPLGLKFSFEPIVGFVDSGLFLDPPLNNDPAFNNDFGNNNNNDGSDNGGSDSSPSSQDLDIEIDISKDPIVRGNIQTISVEVTDDDTNEKISDARVNGEVEYASGSTSNGGQFDKDTESDGEVTHSWRISGNADLGTFKVFVEASKSSYDPVSETESFIVISKDMEEIEAANFTETSDSSFDSDDINENENGDSNPCTAEQASRDHTCTSSSGDNDEIDDWTDPPVEEENNESSESDGENPTTDSQNDVNESENNDNDGSEEDSENNEDNDSDNESDSGDSEN